jgi:drug/metabolite transporter (DMT)-like permease
MYRAGVALGSMAPSGGPAPRTGPPAGEGAADRGPRYEPADLGLLAVVGVVWGLAYIFIREGVVLGASPFLFAAVRYVLSAGAFAVIALARREARPAARGLRVSATLGGFLVIGLYGGLLYWGEQYTAGGYAAVLSTTAPILTVVVAYFLLRHEGLGRRALLGIGVAFVGVVVLVAPTLYGATVGSWQGPVFVVAAFVSAAFGTVLLRRFGGGPQGLWQIASQFAVGGALLTGVSFALPLPRALPWSEGVVGSLVALVLLSSVVGYFAYFRLHHRVGPVRANAVAYLLPLVGVGVGSGFLGEPVTAWEVGGCLVVLAGMTLVVRDSLRRGGAGAAAGSSPSGASGPR